MQKSIIPHFPTDYFNDEDWEKLTKPLREIENEVKNICSKKRLSLKISSRWPSFSFAKRYLFRVRIVTLRLDSNFLHDREMNWEIEKQEITLIPMFYYRLHSHEVVKKIDNQKVLSKSDLIFPLERIIDEYLLRNYTGLCG